MARNKSVERFVCEEYCRQNPKMKSLTLAKKIFEEVGKKYPNMKDVENVRKNYVTRIRGVAGNRYRERCADKSLYQNKTYDTTNSKPYKEEIQTGKILLFDIETAPLRAYLWNVWNQNVQPIQIISDWFCLGWSAKWLFEEKVYSGILKPKEAIEQDDKRIMKGLWGLLNKADIVITQNGIKFDVPKVNTRFLIHGFTPPLPYLHIDLYKVAKSSFSFTYNKQDFISEKLGNRKKLDNGGFERWANCMKGDPTALKEMEKYNVGDVFGLEENYLDMRPWIKPHPNVALYIMDKNQRCVSCGSKDLTQEGQYATSVNIYEAHRCNNCGAVSRKRKANKSVAEREYLLTSVAK